MVSMELQGRGPELSVEEEMSHSRTISRNNPESFPWRRTTRWGGTKIGTGCVCLPMPCLPICEFGIDDI